MQPSRGRLRHRCAHQDSMAERDIRYWRMSKNLVSSNSYFSILIFHNFPRNIKFLSCTNFLSQTHSKYVKVGWYLLHVYVWSMLHLWSRESRKSHPRHLELWWHNICLLWTSFTLASLGESKQNIWAYDGANSSNPSRILKYINAGSLLGVPLGQALLVLPSIAPPIVLAPEGLTSLRVWLARHELELAEHQTVELQHIIVAALAYKDLGSLK